MLRASRAGRELLEPRVSLVLRASRGGLASLDLLDWLVLRVSPEPRVSLVLRVSRAGRVRLEYRGTLARKACRGFKGPRVSRARQATPDHRE